MDISNPDNNSGQVQEHINKAKSLKVSGQEELALTEFRRAAVLDPNIFEVQLEIGRLSRGKAKTDPLFARYSFDAYHKASRMDLQHQQAHDEYITAAQKMGKLEMLYDQYKALIEGNPDNENLKRCRSNIQNLLMAQMPANVSVGDATSTKKLRKALMIAGIGGMLFGVALIFSPIILKSVGKAPLSKETAKNLFRTGLILSVAGTLTIGTRAFVK